MVKIKICGLRRYQDIDYVNDLKVDYAGFVFAPSPRNVDLQLAKKLVVRLDSGIKKVGVFVNQSRDVINRMHHELGLDVIQFHGDETPSDVAGYDVEVWKAIRVKDKKDIAIAREYCVDGILMDTSVAGRYGGTGETFDWNILDGVILDGKLILAGGLTPHNVCSAIAKVKPYAVDVSSGVETDGFKDYQKMKEFVERVRGFERYTR